MSGIGPNSALPGSGSQDCLPVNKLGKPVAYIAQEWEFGPSPLFIVDQFSHVLGRATAV